MDSQIIKILMGEIKKQHDLRLDGCGGCEIEESFDTLKSGMVEELIKKGVRDFTLIKKIQNSQ